MDNAVVFATKGGGDLIMTGNPQLENKRGEGDRGEGKSEKNKRENLKLTGPKLGRGYALSGATLFAACNCPLSPLCRRT